MEQIKYLPQEVKQYEFSVSHLMPLEKDIPREFSMMSSNKWVKFFDDLFFFGVKNLVIIPKTGIDKEKAWKHIRTIMTSWNPPHEYKTSACAYLCSLWFENVTYEVIKKEI